MARANIRNLHKRKGQVINYTYMEYYSMHKLPLLVDVPIHLEYAWYFVWYVRVSVCHSQANRAIHGLPYSRTRSVGRPQHGCWEGGQPKEQH